MLTMADLIDRHTSLNPDEVSVLNQLTEQWELLADLAFSDLILWVPDTDPNIFWAVAQVRPTTGPTALEDDVVGEDITYNAEHLVTAAYLSGEICSTSDNKLSAGIPVDVHAVPINHQGRTIGILELHMNRMGVRTPGALEDTYLKAAKILMSMVQRGLFPSPGQKPVPWVSPRVGDGLVYLDDRGTIIYASPNAVSAFRRLGVTDDLLGENIGEIMQRVRADSGQPTDRAVRFHRHTRDTAEEEVEGRRGSVLIRREPLIDEDERFWTILLCRDTTELRSRERQLVTKDATIREIHHRVKNNLQTVSALLRLQARRTESVEAQDALNDAQKRVSAIAVVHEILSQGFETAVPFDEVADRLMTMVRDVNTSRRLVSTSREGSFGEIPGAVATHLSLVFSEIIQNAIEHGLGDGEGVVVVRPRREDGQLIVEVSNNGEPLADDFRVENTNSLGLSIVATLVADMRGTFTLANGPEGTTVATVKIPLG